MRNKDIDKLFMLISMHVILIATYLIFHIILTKLGECNV
jgi:hypothetical protein